MAFPLPPRPLRLFFSVSEAGQAGETSGLDLFVPTSVERGLIVFNISPANGDEVGFKVTDLGADLDTNIQAVAPATKSNFEQPEQVTLRSGRVSGSLVATAPNWVIIRSSLAPVPFAASPRNEIFVPPGSHFTILKTVQNSQLEVSLGVEEL